MKDKPERADRESLRELFVYKYYVYHRVRSNFNLDLLMGFMYKSKCFYVIIV